MKLNFKVLAILILCIILNLSIVESILRKRNKGDSVQAADSDELTSALSSESGSESSAEPEGGKAADPNASTADVANAGAAGKDVPGYTSNPTPKAGGNLDLSGIEVPKGFQLKVKKPRETSKEEEGYWESFFTQKRGENCSGKKILRLELQKMGVAENGSLMPGQASNGRYGIGSGPFGWIKQWGFGQSAYFFDFLDPSLRPLHLEEFQGIWDKFSKYPKEDNNDYKDPFSLDKPIDPKLDDVSKKKLEEANAKRKEHMESEIYKNSVNAVQLNLGMREQKWHLDKSVSDNAKSFIRKYDMNEDGRLSPRELILGSIYHNKAILGSDDCTLCYEDLTDKIDGIFAYVDCDGNGLVSSEDLYNHLPKLRRDTQKWNFFQLANKATIRTAVTNDFVLKNMYTVNGQLTKPEFRMGILLGFWDRQTDNFGIIKDDKINMKALRWQDDDVVDIGAMNYIKNKAEAEAELKQRQMMASAAANVANQPDISVSMASERKQAGVNGVRR